MQSSGNSVSGFNDAKTDASGTAASHSFSQAGTRKSARGHLISRGSTQALNSRNNKTNMAATEGRAAESSALSHTKKANDYAGNNLAGTHPNMRRALGLT